MTYGEARVRLVAAALGGLVSDSSIWGYEQIVAERVKTALRIADAALREMRWEKGEE